MMAAGQAARQGAKTLLLEKKNRPGRKLAITGKGRCNLTNAAGQREFLEHFKPEDRFLRQAFTGFFNTDLVRFLDSLGIGTVTMPSGKVFPVSERALDVVNALLNWNRQSGVTLLTDVTVKNLLLKDGRISGVQTTSASANRPSSVSPRLFHGKTVIVATGGMSYPATGSTGDGYSLAMAAGHHIVPALPALVPLITAGDLASRLQGLSLQDAGISLWIDGRKNNEIRGEMVFTHFGLSGPAILTLSRDAVAALSQNSKVIISIDLKPSLDEKQLDVWLLEIFNHHGKQQFISLLKRILPPKLVQPFIELLEISPEKPVHQISANERKRLRILLKEFRFEIAGHRSFKEAMITSGGVELREVDPRSMASRLVPNLFFAGEVLNIQADTGGYNLQAAFSTGWLAGRKAAELVLSRVTLRKNRGKHVF